MFTSSRAVPWARRHRSGSVVAIWFALVAIVPASAGESEVRVYTIRSIPVSAPAEATIVHLDDAGAIEEELSAGLPHDPAHAITTARQRLTDGGAELQRDLVAAYEDIAEAWSLGITTLPAVVVDRRYIIYGEADVARAIARIEAFRRTQP